MAAARVNRLGPGGLLLLGPIVALVVHHGAEVLSADACLDLSRHRLNRVLASLASSAGLILMWRSVLRRRTPPGRLRPLPGGDSHRQVAARNRRPDARKHGLQSEVQRPLGRLGGG